MNGVRHIRTAQLFLILIVIWSVTNLSTMVSAFHDGRSVSLGLFKEDATWYQRNSSDDLNATIERLNQHEVPVFSEWLLTQTYQDAMNYVKMAMGERSYEPYSLRILYPKLVGLVAAPLNALMGGPGVRRVSIYSMVFIAFNVTLFILSIYVAARFLVTEGLPPFGALMITILTFLQLGFLSTLHSPMTDQASVFLSLCFLLLMVRERHLATFVLSIVMVLTKDSLVIFAAIPMLAFLVEKRWVHLMIASGMIAAFVGLRLYAKVDPLSMQFGWDVSRGEFQPYILLGHFGSVPGVVNWALGLWSSFGPALVLGPLLMTRSQTVSNQDRRRLQVLLGLSVLFMVAQAALAGRVARTVAPASIPFVLLTFGLAYKYYHSTIETSLNRLLR